LQAGDDLLRPRRRPALEPIEVVPEHGADAVRGTRVGAAGASEQHAGALAREVAAGGARGGPRPAGPPPRHELPRGDAAQAGRRDAPLDRVETDLAQEAAPAGIDPVGSLALLGEVVLDAPALRGDFLDGIDAVADVLPVALQVLRLGEHASHADDGDRFF